MSRRRSTSTSRWATSRRPGSLAPASDWHRSQASCDAPASFGGVVVLVLSAPRMWVFGALDDCLKGTGRREEVPNSEARHPFGTNATHVTTTPALWTTLRDDADVGPLEVVALGGERPAGSPSRGSSRQAVAALAVGVAVPGKLRGLGRPASPAQHLRRHRVLRVRTGQAGRARLPASVPGLRWLAGGCALLAARGEHVPARGGAGRRRRARHRRRAGQGGKAQPDEERNGTVQRSQPQPQWKARLPCRSGAGRWRWGTGTGRS